MLVASASVLVACADDGPPVAGPVPSATVSGEPTSDPTVPAPTEPTGPAATEPAGSEAPPSDPAATNAPDAPIDTLLPLTNAGGENEAFRGVGQLAGLRSSCTAFLLDIGPPSGPAYALTTGRCVGLSDRAAVVRDQPVDGVVVRFGPFADTSVVAEVGVASVRYATRRGSDIAVLELASTRSAVIGLAPYSLARPPSPGEEIRVVGVMAGDDADEEEVLRADACAAGPSTRVAEGEWLSDAAIPSDCAGTSGSPVFRDNGSTRVVGVVSTTTFGAAAGATCDSGLPCELTPTGAVLQPGRTYAVPVDAWADCFAPGWEPTAEGCPVESAPP